MKKWNDFRVSYPVAATFFGIIVGPAMASGAYAVTYYSKFGAAALWLPLVTLAVIGIEFFFGLNFARANKLYDWGSFSQALYGKYHKIINPLYTFYMIIFGFVSMSVMFSMGAQIFMDILGVGYYVAALLAGILMILLMLYGGKVVRNSNAVMSFLLLGAMLLFAVLSLKVGGGRLGEIIGSWDVWPGEKGMFGAVISAAAFGFAISNNFLPTLSVADQISSRRQCGIGAITTVVISYLILLMTIIITLPFAPESLTQSTPVLWVVQTHVSGRMGLLGPAYTFLLFVAVMSSSPAILLAQAARWNPILPSKGVFANNKVKSIIVALVYCVGGIMIGKMGLLAIVSKLFNILGYVSIPMIFVPVVFTTWQRVKKQDALNTEK